MELSGFIMQTSWLTVLVKVKGLETSSSLSGTLEILAVCHNLNLEAFTDTQKLGQLI